MQLVSLFPQQHPEFNHMSVLYRPQQAYLQHRLDYIEERFGGEQPSSDSSRWYCLQRGHKEEQVVEYHPYQPDEQKVRVKCALLRQLIELQYAQSNHGRHAGQDAHNQEDNFRALVQGDCSCSTVRLPEEHEEQAHGDQRGHEHEKSHKQTFVRSMTLREATSVFVGMTQSLCVI